MRVKDNADAIIAIAPWIYNLFKANGITKRLYLVKQGAKVDSGNSLSKKGVPRAKKISLVFIGRMHPSKGFHLLAEALDNIRDRRFILDIYTMQSGGEHDYYLKYKAWAKDIPGVNWYESIPHQELMEQLKDKDLLILPSLANEMAPLVILESNHFKIPVLGSSYPAISDMIADNVSGRLFKSNDANDLQEKLQEILENPEVIQKWSLNIGPVRTFKELVSEMDCIYKSLLH